MSGVWNRTLQAIGEDPSYRRMFSLLKQYGANAAAEISDNKEIRTISYDQYVSMSYSACGNLQRTGAFAKGECVGLLYETCPGWPVLFWGILMSGGVPLLMNPAFDSRTIRSILTEAGCSCYICARDLKMDSMRWIDSRTVLSEGEPGVENWADEVALCTSGTTGKSRIFVYDGKAVSAQIRGFNEAHMANRDMPLDDTKPVKLLAFLPFYHVFGFSVVYLLYSCTGSTVVYLRDRSVPTILEACRKHEVTHLYCVPMFFNALANGIKRQMLSRMSEKQFNQTVSKSLMGLAATEAGVRKSSLTPDLERLQASLLGPQIKVMITGGGHVPSETLKIINSVGYPLYNGFGMTETGIVSVELSTNPMQRAKGSMGIPFQSTEYRIVDCKGSESSFGELQIRGDGIHSACIANGRKTLRDRSAWFCTGDIVSRKKDGLFIEGRIKDVIVNASGENIYPDDLEDEFAVLPEVESSTIIGIKNGTYEDVALVCRLSEKQFEEGYEEYKCSLVESVLAVNRTLPAYRHVSRLFVTGKDFPVSASLKVKRLDLKNAIEEGTWPCEELSLRTRPSRTEESAVEASEVSRSGCAENSSGESFKSGMGSPASLDELKASIREIFSQALGVEPKAIDDDAHFVMDLGGDSLCIFNAVAIIEKKYGLTLLDSEMRGISNVSDTAKLLYGKLTGSGEAPVKASSDVMVPKSRRITDFSKSREYTELRKRIEQTFPDPRFNPYFVPHDSLIRDTSIIRGKEVINLGSYNYLGLSGHPETVKAAVEAAVKYGTSASGSRTLAGEKTLYMELERTIAKWKHTEDAIVCTGGWATNLSFISCFMKEGDLILYDMLAHNSMTEGVSLSKASSKAFAHNDLEGLEAILKQVEDRYNKVLIVVEGVYSMDGDIAPIPRFVELKKRYGCFLMVDEAHSSGVIGEHAGGVDDYFGLEPHDIDIKMGTLSKALGTCGGYIAADSSIVQYLRYSMNGFVFTAGISPVLAAACKRAIELIMEDNSMARNLHRNIEYFTRRCREEGFDIGLSKGTAIVPVLVGTDEAAARLSSLLLERGVFVPPAMYPAVPKGESRLRFTISATHSLEQLEKAVSELAALMREEKRNG